MNLEYTWDDFSKTIDFSKINKIEKQVKDENLDEGLRVFSFLSKFRDDLKERIPELSLYKTGKNSHPTQPQWSKENGFRVGYYYGNKNYMPSTQLNITIGADWGGGIFIKDNKNLIFGNEQLLTYLKKKYSTFDFDEEQKGIGAIWFENDISTFPTGEQVVEHIALLSEIFKIMIKINKMKDKTNLLKNRNQIILQGPPGTGKTRVAKQMAISMINAVLPLDTNDEIKDSFKVISDQVKLIQFHPSYSYEDFVRGIVADSSSEDIEYKTENKVLAQMAEKALNDKEKPYILIIDEINRANLSSVLGELIYALEYRNEAVESMYALEDGSREIILPSNLYIIGTMNTADRSVGHIDYAIRRRFAFESVLPDESVIDLAEGKTLFSKVEEIFENISMEFDKDDVMLGHSYFIAKNTDELKEKLQYQVKPLLREYLKDGVLKDEAKTEIDALSV